MLTANTVINNVNRNTSESRAEDAEQPYDPASPPYDPCDASEASGSDNEPFRTRSAHNVYHRHRVTNYRSISYATSPPEEPEWDNGSAISDLSACSFLDSEIANRRNTSRRHRLQFYKMMLARHADLQKLCVHCAVRDAIPILESFIHWAPGLSATIEAEFTKLGWLVQTTLRFRGTNVMMIHQLDTNYDLANEWCAFATLQTMRDIGKRTQSLI